MVRYIKIIKVKNIFRITDENYRLCVHLWIKMLDPLPWPYYWVIGSVFHLETVTIWDNRTLKRRSSNDNSSLFKWTSSRDEKQTLTRWTPTLLYFGEIYNRLLKWQHYWPLASSMLAYGYWLLSVFCGRAHAAYYRMALIVIVLSAACWIS